MLDIHRMKAYRNIVIFGNARWREDICGNSSQQLGLAFLQLGYRVLYITPNTTSPVRVQEFPETFRNLSISKQIVQKVQSVLNEWSADPLNAVFICSLATRFSGELIKFFSSKGFDIVYRSVDWFDPSNKEHSFDQGAFLLAARVARMITISHPDLIQNLPANTRKVITLTNGVDFDLFSIIPSHAKTPDDLMTGTITIGFWGTFWGNRMDWTLIRFLAERNPGWQFNLIGDLQYLDVNRKTLSSNVHFLGLKNKSDLPAYIRHLHLCLIPYRTDIAFAKYSNPIKALESITALKPVVAPVNASLAPYPAVFLYRSREEAEQKIIEAAQAKLNHNEMRDFAYKNSWQRHAQRLLEELKSA